MNSNNAIIFVAALGLGAYAVYTVGDLQTVIYAVCGAYVLRLLMQNPEILAQLQEQLAVLQGHRRQPVARAAPPPTSIQHPHPEMNPALQRDSTIPVTTQPRLDMNFLEQTGYQPLQQQQPPQQRPTALDYDSNTPTTPIPSYSQYSAPPVMTSSRLPSRTESRASNFADNFPVPTRNPYGSYSHYDAGTINGERLNLPPPDRATPRPDSRASVASGFSDFPAPARNPYGSYSHYDAGTIGGERLVQRVEVPNEYTIPQEFNLNERIAAPPQRPDSQRSVRSDTLPILSTHSHGSYSTGPPSRTGSVNSHSSNTFAPSSLRTETTPKEEYVPKRQHRKPTVAARVGEVAAPGGGIAPPPTSLASPEIPIKFFNSPLIDSPQVTSPRSGYESDSSHASSSSSSRNSNERVGLSNSHARAESTASLGLPTYEKHATTIFTLVPKRPGYVPQIQAILKAARTAWLALPGSVSHEVGQDNATGSVVVVEMYETSESMDDFEKSKERDTILGRLKTFIDESKTTVVRLPGSSAATRIVR